MKILLIDTCGGSGSLALAESDSGAILATDALPGRSASERLLPAIKSLATSAGLTLQALGAVGIVNGPGSFTGVRVGLSAAKGLCEALSLPLIAVSRLAVLAEMALLSASACARTSDDADVKLSRVYALLDAGRGEFYFGDYDDGVLLREVLLSREAALAAVNAGPQDFIAAACEPAVAALLTELSPRLLPEPAAADAVPLVLQRLAERAFDDAAAIDANYVRRTDAEIFAKPTAASSSARTGTTDSAGSATR